jgi:hypothetical protein
MQPGQGNIPGMMGGMGGPPPSMGPGGSGQISPSGASGDDIRRLVSQAGDTNA